MNDDFSRRGFFARFMAACGWFVTRDAAAVTQHDVSAECVTSYRYDDLGRLLSITYARRNWERGMTNDE